MTPTRLSPVDPRLSDTLDLIQRVFSEHDGRIDPPSSMHRLALADLEQAARDGEVWVIGTPPVACVILSERGDALYLSKLSVDPSARGTGLGRRLIDLAERRARVTGCAALELQTRIELTENHVVFRALGFLETGQTAHPGYDRPTSLTMRKTLNRSPDARE